MHRRVKRHVAFGVEKRYHLVPRVASTLGPLQEHFHGSGRCVFRRLVDRVVAIVAGLSVVGAQVSHLQSQEKKKKPIKLTYTVNADRK